MSRIGDAFRGGRAFIPFITGGDPSLAVTGELIRAMAEAGADLIEIGIPFSDPVAEDAAVQAAGGRALAAGCTTDGLFDLAAEVREQVETPLVFVSYANSIYTYGKEAFMRRCRECGVDGLMVRDLPFEERDEIRPECGRFGIDLIPTAVPSPAERIRRILKEAEGFVCLVLQTGSFSAEDEGLAGVRELVRLAREASGLPCVLDLSGASPEQAGTLAALADGIAEGRALVELAARYGKACAGPAAEYVRRMKEALKAE